MVFSERAEFLREVSGSSILTATLNKVVSILALFKIPHYVAGGYAVQEHGYSRFTSDLDIIVPDVQTAREKLSINGFKENPGSSMTLTDRETKVEIDLLPGGGKVGPGINFPVPRVYGSNPIFLDLYWLISLKLSSYEHNKFSRAKDMSDVVELIKANLLPRSFKVDSTVEQTYLTIWDGLHKDGAI